MILQNINKYPAIYIIPILGIIIYSGWYSVEKFVVGNTSFVNGILIMMLAGLVLLVVIDREMKCAKLRSKLQLSVSQLKTVRLKFTYLDLYYDTSSIRQEINVFIKKAEDVDDCDPDAMRKLLDEIFEISLALFAIILHYDKLLKRKVQYVPRHLIQETLKGL